MAVRLQRLLLMITGIILTCPPIVSQSSRSLSPSPSDCLIITVLRLKNAECRNRNLKVIPADLDRDIKVLKFSDNQLTLLGMDEFRSYRSLQEIYLAHNRIDAIAPDAFRGLTNLQLLDLEGNELTFVPSQAFTYVATMRILIMKSNPIRYVPADAFRHLRNIEELNFENCWLKGVHPDAFRRLNRLNEINLVNNELKGLDVQMVLPPSVNVVRLYRNPWRCDCRLRWLLQWVSSTGVNWDFTRKTPTCAAPSAVQGRSWKELSSAQFSCAARILGNSSVFLTPLAGGANVTLDCNAFGDPQPRVTWMYKSTVIGADMDTGKYLVVEIISDTDIHSALTVLYVGREDAGDYRCVANNTAGMSEITYRITVTNSAPPPDTGFPLFPFSITIIAVIAGTGTVIILLLATIIICCLRAHDRKRRKYKVREHKYKDGAAKCVESTEDLRDEDSVKDDMPVSLPSTQLLLGETLDVESIADDTSEFKMKIFTYPERPKERENRNKHGVMATQSCTYPTMHQSLVDGRSDESIILPVAPDLISHEPHSPYIQKTAISNDVAVNNRRRAEENRYVASRDLKPAIKLYSSALCHSADSLNSLLSQSAEPRNSNRRTRTKHPVTFSENVRVQTIPGKFECQAISHPIPGHDRSLCRNPICNQIHTGGMTLPRQNVLNANGCKSTAGVRAAIGNGCVKMTCNSSGKQRVALDPLLRPSAAITASLVKSLRCSPRLSAMPERSSSLQNGVTTVDRRKKPSLRAFASSSLDDILSPPFQYENDHVASNGDGVNDTAHKDTVV